jgi:two-component system cell cycle sensor histidine kinase PleC
MAMFVRNELAAQPTLLPLAAIFSLASMFWAPWTQAIVWLGVVIVAKVVLLECCNRFQATPVAQINVEQWRRRLVMAEAINGTAWAGFALVGIGQDAAATQDHVFSSHVFIFASLMVVLAIRMNFASTVMPILYFGTVPMTAAVVARLLLLQDFFYVALATMAVGVHIYFIFLARGLHSTARAMLEYRAQKEALIAQLEEATSISEEARQRAEAANVAKSRFLATMSHELRTPLNAILGFSEVMKSELMGPLENPTYREYTASIHRSGSHLLNLINEILDLSRIEAGRYELAEEPVLLAGVVDDCYRLMKLRAEDKGLEVIQSFDEALPQVLADERALRQICLNLLSNALKFTPRGGKVTLKVARAWDGGQLISVRDTGPGIPKDEIPKVMQAFGQGSLAHETAEGGTGLGLPIVRSLVELHGGSFELRSEPGKGTEAIAFFPRKRVLARRPRTSRGEPRAPSSATEAQAVPASGPRRARTAAAGPAR